MTKIIKDNKLFNQADPYIVPFLEYYYKNIKTVHFISVKEGSAKRPDYYIRNTESIIEVKEIHDRESNEKYAQWGKIVNKLQKAINKNNLLNQVKGTYLINTPEVFKLYEFNNTSLKLLEEIIKGIDKQKTIKISGINFEINKVSEQESIVVFGSTGNVESIDPAGIVYQNISAKIKNANEQLSFNPNNIEPSKKILLLANKYYLPLYDWDLFKAVSFTYTDLLTYENIDEIWYQLQIKDKGFEHKLLYSKNFFNQFECENITSVNNNEKMMFASWFSALAELDEDKKNKLFSTLKFILNGNEAFLVFPNDDNREQMIRFGLWLLEKDRVSDATWLIEQFINDPDPPEPGQYNGDPTFDYDQNIRNGNGTPVITTVMGHLAWLVNGLAKKSYRHEIKNLKKAYNYIEQILTTKKNLYIIQQWLIPLVEVAAKRLWVAEEDLGTYFKFRNLVLDEQDGLIVNYIQYPEIAKFLTDILDFFKDLTTEEADFILDYLIKTQEGPRLIVYYALYREKHYKKTSELAPIIKKINKKIFYYKPNKAIKLLGEITLDKENKYSKLRSSIAWQFWKILNDLPDNFCFLSKWINNLFDSPYDKQTFSNLFLILEKWYGQTTECNNPSHKWLMVYLKKIADYAVDDIKGSSIWIDMDQIVNKIAELFPSDLIIILKNFTAIWLVGAYIGSLDIIFSSYQKIVNKDLKDEVKALSQKLYKQLQEANPKIRDINWI